MSSAYTRRLEAYLESLYLISTTFAALSLHEPLAIGDTLLSLTCSFLERRSGALLRRGGDDFVPSTTRGSAGESELGKEATYLRALAEARVAQIIPPTELPASMRCSPAFEGGLAAVAITLDDQPVALVVVGASSGEEPFVEADLSFLTAVAGIGALSLASARAVSAQQALARDMEQAAASARRVADERAELLSELDRKLAIIDRQHNEILSLSAPVLEVWQGVLLLPIIGAFDARRGAEMVPRLLAAVTTCRASHVIIDVTGAELAGRLSAEQLLKLMTALRLLGARGIITGVKPEMATAMIALGVDLSSITTLRSLEQGLQLCMQTLSRPGGPPSGELRARASVERANPHSKDD